MPPPSTEIDPDIVAKVLLGEAANQGVEGLELVADTMFNRAVRRKKTLEEVATAPAQFSAFARPDLEQFYQRQPIYLRQLALALVDERRNQKFIPKYQTQFYVTKSLWDRRDSLPKNHWLRKMKVVQTVGDHVALQE